MANSKYSVTPSSDLEVNGTHHYFVVTATDCSYKIDIDREKDSLFLGNNLYTYSMSHALCSDLEVCERGFSNVRINGTVLKGGTSELYVLDCSFFSLPLKLFSRCVITLEKTTVSPPNYTRVLFFLKDGQLLHGRLVVLTDVSATV